MRRLTDNDLKVLQYVDLHPGATAMAISVALPRAIGRVRDTLARLHVLGYTTRQKPRKSARGSNQPWQYTVTPRTSRELAAKREEAAAWKHFDETPAVLVEP